MDDEKLTDLAVDVVLSMMSSASTDKISPLAWWPRAKSSLETAADVAESWQHMVSKMAAKLQIDSTTNATAAALKIIGEKIGDSFGRFRNLCRRDAIFIVAMAQAEREEQRLRAKTKQSKEDRR